MLISSLEVLKFGGKRSAATRQTMVIVSQYGHIDITCMTRKKLDVRNERTQGVESRLGKFIDKLLPNVQEILYLCTHLFPLYYVYCKLLGAGRSDNVINKNLFDSMLCKLKLSF